MPSAVRVDYRPVSGIGHRFNGCIQHGVDQLSIRARANGPAHHHPVEAIDDRRQVQLARRYLELRDVRQPFLIGRCSLEWTSPGSIDTYQGESPTWSAQGVHEPPRLLRRLFSLRGLSHDEVKQVFPRGP